MKRYLFVVAVAAMLAACNGQQSGSEADSDSGSISSEVSSPSASVEAPSPSEPSDEEVPLPVPSARTLTLVVDNDMDAAGNPRLDDSDTPVAIIWYFYGSAADRPAVNCAWLSKDAPSVDDDIREVLADPTRPPQVVIKHTRRTDSKNVAAVVDEMRKSHVDSYSVEPLSDLDSLLVFGR